MLNRMAMGHIILRREKDVVVIKGDFVVNRTDGSLRQCAGAAQFLTGTRTPDGVLHDAPSARHGGWTQGARLTKETPDGTLVARRWENGVYPNKDIRDYNPEAVAKDSSIINHAGVKIGWDDKTGQAIILDQWKSERGPLQAREYDAEKEDWRVVNATKRFDPKASDSDFRFELQKQTQDEAQRESSSVIHSKPREVSP
jgi:hypothetical protein